jgi:hypothetical protein
VGPRAGADAMGKRTPLPLPGIEPRLLRLPAHFCTGKAIERQALENKVRTFEYYERWEMP